MDVRPASDPIVDRHVIRCAFIRFFCPVFMAIWSSWICDGQWLVSPILQANSLANAEILASGKELTVANGGISLLSNFLINS